MRLRASAPFFAVLAMHADYVETTSIRTAATDGRNIYYNPEFLAGLAQDEVVGLILHEVLHCAFAHIGRRGLRDKTRWNMAADLVINPMVIELRGASLPEGALLEQRFEGLRVEEAYDLLGEEEWQALELVAKWQDLLSDSEARAAASNRERSSAAATTGPTADPNHWRRELERYWRNAVNGAALAQARGAGIGDLPKGARLLVEQLNEPRLDWRQLLWEYTVEHPFDFGEYDLRLVGRGIYEEQLEGQKLELHVALDTSGSCVGWASEFLSELKGMLEAFPHVTAHVYFADVALVGPYRVERFAEVPTPVGGGGTSFVPFFDHVAEHLSSFEHHVLVYLTDGYGFFPQTAPQAETVWVVPPGGLPAEGFPFGRVIRLGNRA